MHIGYFKVKQWNESFVIQEKVAHAKAEYSITGDLNGEMDVDYSIFYLHYDKEEIHHSSSMFTGFMLFKGNIGDKTGSFVLEDNGSFINHNYNALVKIVEGSGTGDFIDIKGNGTYYPKQDGMRLEIQIEY